MNRAHWIRIFRYSLAITLLSLMIAFIQLYHVPKLKSWILYEVQNFSKKSLPADIIAAEVRFRFWPPGVEFRNVGVTPKAELLQTLLPLKIDKVIATVSPLGLLKGQLRVGRLLLQGSDVRLFIRDNSKASKDPIQIDWDMIYQLPVDQVAISRVHLAVDSHVGDFKGSIQRLAVRVHNRNQSLRVRILADDLRLKKDENELVTDLVSDFTLDKNGIYFQGIRLKRESSFLFTSGRVSGDMETLKFKDSDFKLRSQFNLKEVTTLLRDILGQQKIPQLGGTAFITSDIQYDFKKIPNAVTQVEGSDISVNALQIGNILFNSQIKNQQLQIQSLKIANAGATIELHKTQLQTQSPYKFSTEVKGQKVHIKRLLASLGIGDVPVESDFNFAIPCSGQIEPSIDINCEGSIREGWAKVTSDNGKTIVEFDKAEVDGKFKVTKQSVSYKAQVRIGKSKAETDGVISYEKGFNINYKSDLARFEDFKNLVNLKLTGEAQIKGKTQGTSKSATFQMALNGKNIWFEDFGLGDLTTDMSYRAGNIYFNDAQGKMNQTHYQGQIRFDITKNILDVSGRAPFVSIEDLQYMTSRRVPLPLKITGTGSATFKIRGPPELNKLSSDINSSFFRGDISGESYDQLHLSVQSVDGFLTTERIQLIKGASVASLSGTLSPKGEVKAYATAKNFFIDQSEFLKSLNLNVAGNLNMEAEFGGLFMKPEIKAKGTIVNMLVADRPANNSNFSFRLNEKEIDGQATLMGESILVGYKWPFSDTGAYALSLKAKKWNFAQFFNITNESTRAISHLTELTAELNLEGPRPAIAATSGFIKIDKLLIKNGNSEIASQKPISLDIKNGMLADSEFVISGDNNYFKFSSNKSALDRLDVKVDGRLDLLLVSILTPFLDDLRGTIAINVGITGAISSPNFMGSLVVQDGFVRLKNFPHPFEQIKGDLLFSQKKLLINTFRSRLAGGIISGGGQIEFIGTDNIPIDVRGAFQDCVFNIPDGMSTRGSGEFYIHGNYVPYTLGGLYSIYSGSLDKKINSSEEVVREVKPSPYLPKFLVEKQSSPIHLDLETILQNPVSVAIQMPQVVVRTAVDGRLIIKGPPDSPLLTGRLNLSVPSVINVRNNVFNITGGTVDYKNYPASNPELNVSAESRISLILKDIEREYDVYARFTGPAQKLNIQMTSQPQLSENELISLVTLGYVNEADRASDTSNLNAQASSTGYQIGSQFLDEQLGINRRLEKSLGVNLKYSSSFDASDQAARHTFILKKQWSPRFGTSASRSVGKSDTNNVRAEYKLNRNMSVIGSWEGKEQTGANQSETDEGETNIFGLDLEFKREFK